MASFNKVLLMGNLTRDPEFKQIGGGQNVCRLGIASNRQYRNKQSGEMVQEVCFVDVDVWGAQAESCRQYLSKGRPVLVEGRLKYDSWQDQDGKSRNRHSIVAERVVFLSAGAQDQASESSTDEQPLEPRNEVERELMSQLDDIKNRKRDGGNFSGATAPKKSAAKPAFSSRTKDAGLEAGDSELAQAFKDEPPFQDDLPF